MKVDDPQLSSVCLVIHCVLRVNLLFRKFVGCGGPKLTGGASGRGVLRGTFGPGQKKKKKISSSVQKKKKKKKRKHGHNYPSSSEILVSNSLFFCLPTVQLHFTPILNFKQSTQAQKKKKNLSSVFSYPLYMYISILFFRKQATHTHAHTKSSLGCY